MQFKTLTATILLGFLSTTSVATINPGTYYIVSRATGKHGAPLAVTSTGENNPAVIHTKSHTPQQQWTITEYDGNGQAVLFAADTSLEAGRVGNLVAVIPEASQVWDINPTDDGYYSIVAAFGVARWGVTSTTLGSSVVVGTKLGDDGEWIFEAI